VKPKDQILALLPKLSPNGLKAIRAACDGLIGTPATPLAGTPQNGLYDALMAVTGQRLGWQRFKASQPGKHFAANEAAFLSFMNGAFPLAMKKQVTAQAVMRSVLDLIAADLRAKQVPVTAGTLATNLPRAAEIFRAAFPGYLENRLGDFIVEAMKRG
jgi:hypothetical protein